jgi:dTDP-glucose pyrophosphorylase
VETAEKKPLSDLAIAGAYYFGTAGMVALYADRYRKTCPYNETFVSGLYGIMAAEGEAVYGVELGHHVSFGTPDEYTNVVNTMADENSWLRNLAVDAS